MAKTDATKALGGGKKKPRLSDINIRPTANGGYIARHVMAGKSETEPMMNGSEPQEYGLSDKAALMAHMDQHLPDDPDPADAAPAPNAA